MSKKRKNIFLLMAALISILFWLSESLIHQIIYLEGSFELIPSNPNELWMRFVIISLILLFGIYADHYTKKLLEKEKEKRIIFDATIRSAQYIINNLINQLQFFKIQADEMNAYDSETNRLYDHALEEVKSLLTELSSVELLSETNIVKSVQPANKKH